MRRRRVGARLGMLAASISAVVFSLVSCNLHLTPYADPVDAGNNDLIPFDSGNGDGSSADGSNVTDSSIIDVPPQPDTGTDAGKVKRVFVTQGTFTGTAIGGVAGADAKCQAAAAGATLGGNWIAWISIANNTALARITSQGPYFLVDKKTLVFASKAAIAEGGGANGAGGPSVQISIDEKGINIGAGMTTAVWTGTTAKGEAAPQNCANFAGPSLAGLMGSASATSDTWTEDKNVQCTTPGHLYCFEQ